MADKFISERNLKFLINEVFDAPSLLQFPRYSHHTPEVFDMVIDTAMKMGRDLLKPSFEEMDKNPPRFEAGAVKVHPSVKRLMKECGEGGWISAVASLEVGGQQLPFTVGLIPTFVFSAANYSASNYPGLNMGAAHLIESFGSQEQKDTYIPLLFSGAWQGTMALTEPQAGSSVGDITTTASPTDKDYYLIRGQKIFISAADHDCVDNVVNLMLARIEGAPPGLKGISLFIVPKKRFDNDGNLVPNDLAILGIYHKMGYRGCPITQLSLGDNGDCRGWLVGEPNRGLYYMLQMMNEARLVVGMNAAAIASAAYYACLQYTRERPQGRPITSKDPSAPQIPIIEHADIKRMLLFQRAVIEGSLGLLFQCTVYSDLMLAHEGDEREKYSLLLDLLTPVAKTYPAEMAIHSVSQALQCLGGYGYCDEFPIEQHYRDTRIHPIHEGTTGIQALTLLGRNVVMKNGKALTLFLDEVEGAIKKAGARPELAAHAAQLKKAVEKLKEVIGHLVGIATGGNIDLFLADATLFMEFFGVIAVAWQWLLQALAAQSALAKGASPSDEDFYTGKMYAFRYFFAYELPKTEGMAQRLLTIDDLTLSMKPDYFSD
ncbi:MAG: acyl-CoA dehydrogenase [Deltaproteobacteria bacterium]|nr:acyl-CoA dehydrogenase [Candidatus Zymogenaceae bacterium]